MEGTVPGGRGEEVEKESIIPLYVDVNVQVLFRERILTQLFILVGVHLTCSVSIYVIFVVMGPID